ncbi:hypothetical protein [uncultured Jatrophihabitans sp.]|uniref:hypothetical protein n=1 Tax=uncultured Jatrophihabitans sp. TaxID=1610747 RepID=UPI0035CA5737
MDAADRLLEAHVAYQLERLRGAQFGTLVGAEVDHALDHAARLTLDDVVHRDQVKAVAAKYVSTFELPGAIPEIVGEITAALSEHPAQDVELGAVIDRRHVRAAATKIAELRSLRQAVAERIADNPAVQAWLAQYLLSMATTAVNTNRSLLQRMPGMTAALAAGERVAGRALREVDQRSRELAERTAVIILARWRDSAADAIDDDQLAEALLGVWDQVADRRMRDVLVGTDQDDLVDLVVIGYELWLDLRGTDYLRSLVDTGIDYFFDTYGEFALDALLREFGIDRDDLVEEALRFAPGVIARLDEAGVLADLVRRQLVGFYASPAARAILDDHRP